MKTQIMIAALMGMTSVFAADGVVALWGGIHDINLVKNSDVPVFLAHGDSDYVMPYNVGHAISKADKMIADVVPEKYSAFAKAFKFQIKTPTIYGSYAIDSVLTARGETVSLEAVAGGSYFLKVQGDAT